MKLDLTTALNETARRVFDSGTMGVVFVDRRQRIIGRFGNLIDAWVPDTGAVTDALPFLAGYEDILDDVAAGRREQYDLFKISVSCPPEDRRRVFSIHVYPRGADGELGIVLQDMTSMTELEQRVVQHRNELALAERDLKRAKEQAEAANQAKSLFLSHIGHELFTPLQVIIGDAELLKETDVTRFPEDNVRAYVSDILQHATFLNDLIADLLDLARIEAGRMTLDEERVDLAAIIAEAVALISRMPYAAGVDIALDPDSLVPDVHADPRRLKQILINLIGNAAKFTPPFGRVRVRAEVEEGRGLVIAVTDTGAGIDTSDLPRVTEPFVQAGTAPAAKPAHAMAGAGLGLPLAKTLIRLHGGELILTSIRGAGTTARIILPPSRILYDAR